MTTEPVCSLVQSLSQSEAIPKPINEFRVGDYAILGESVCRILELKKSKPGKHGSAKILFIGRSLDTGKHVQEIGIRNMPWLPKPKAAAAPTTNKENKADKENKANKKNKKDEDAEKDLKENGKPVKFTILYLDVKRNIISLIDDDDNIRDDISMPTDSALRRNLIKQWEAYSRDGVEMSVQVVNSDIVALG